MQLINPYRMFLGCFIPNWLSEMKDVSQGAKICYGRLCQFANKDTGYAFPKVENLAKSIGTEVRQTARYLSELKEKELILIKSGKKCGYHNLYFFLYHPKMTGWDICDLVGMSHMTHSIIYNEMNHIKDINSIKIPIAKKESKKDKQIREDFEYIWNHVPKRDGANSKKAGFKAYFRQIKKGTQSEDILKGTIRYRLFCDAKGLTGTEKVYAFYNFLNKYEGWKEPWNIPAEILEQKKNKEKKEAQKVIGELQYTFRELQTEKKRLEWYKEKSPDNYDEAKHSEIIEKMKGIGVEVQKKVDSLGSLHE